MRMEFISVVGTELMTAMDDNSVVYVAMKPLINGMGLDLNSQFEKLKNDSRFNYGVIPMVGLDGKTREMGSLALDHLPAFLYSINPNKVRKDLRETIIAFQNETFAVINAYWRGKQKPNSELEDIIMAQNATIANQQRQLSQVPRIEHKNSCVNKADIIQMIAEKKHHVEEQVDIIMKNALANIRGVLDTCSISSRMEIQELK